MECKNEKVNMREAARKARETAKWAKTMTKVALRYASQQSLKWQIISFEGPRGQESAGIVDLIAIRRNHSKTVKSPLKPGDLFEIILIQVKGGTAEDPTADDKIRLAKVKEFYQAKYIILASWKKGKLPIFKHLLENLEWEEIDPENIFK